jgi:hypothetical protein
MNKEVLSFMFKLEALCREILMHITSETWRWSCISRPSDLIRQTPATSATNRRAPNCHFGRLLLRQFRGGMDVGHA